ncbi:sugar ABC transporter permease [Paenibacillus sp. LHD-117]|uniref:carbohydrate ABC transporter permease n=1 Tax=Paenibacillus sp. LHD-117 TaxID=3071412 RepID=UPI0027E0CBBD|nr:sugar ABC transporter permease [Paenibacillus sp. LHD-117]MDQ6422750.1 sugar ABC transporter permease [Paenibacillus sp. LHD-117]
MNKRLMLGDLKAFLFTLPAMIPLMVFWFIPLGYVVYLSFTEWDFMSPVQLFVGLDNYRYLFENPAFYQSLRVTIWFCLGSVVPSMAIGLLLAIMLSGKLKGGSIYRTMMFAPWVTPTVAVSIVWSWIYEPEVGLANSALSLLGLEGVKWLLDPAWALVAVLIMTVWKSAGWCMIFYLAAIGSVPKDQLEAAELDGANRWQRFTRVTLPLISPTTFFLVIVQLVAAIQTYDQINILTQGGPSGSTRTLLYLYYQSAFSSFQIGEASAVAITIILGCAALSLVSFVAGRKTVHY